jgi:hypothetical protein
MNNIFMYIKAATCSGSRMTLPQMLPTEDQLKARRQLDEARRAFRARKTDTRRKIVGTLRGQLTAIYCRIYLPLSERSLLTELPPTAA